MVARQCGSSSTADACGDFCALWTQVLQLLKKQITLVYGESRRRVSDR